jgi:hypothetical protein
MKHIYTLIALMAFVLSTSSFSQNARLQVIHNAADPAAASVDIYVNGSKLLNDFQFRAATPFIDVPAGVLLNIGIAPSTSTGVTDTIKNIGVQLESGKKYVAIANGVLSPSGFSPNPDSRSISFALFAKDGAREKAMWPWLVDVRAFHGATDAPTVRIYVNGAMRFPLGEQFGYGTFGRYASLLARKYTLDVTAGGSENVVASFVANLSALKGGAATIFASGFLNPSANQNGSAFGLFAALPNGTVVELPKLGTARLQVIHNAADPAAASVDVYVNGSLLLDNFAFRSATPFVDVPAGIPVNIGIAPSTSTSANDTLKNFTVTFSAGKTYVAIANGVISPSNFAQNPDNHPIGFTLFPKANVREKGISTYFVDLLAFHGATDAPTVDIKIKGLSFFPLFNDLNYSKFSTYRTVPPFRYVLQVTPGNSNAVVAEFVADLRTLKGMSATVFASGFLSPSANQNGSAFGLYAALANGTVVALPVVVPGASQTTDELTAEQKLFFQGQNSLPIEFSLAQNYPNPFNPTTVIKYQLPENGFVTLKIYDILGKEVAALVDEFKEAGSYNVEFNASSLSSGLYFYKLQTGNFVSTKKMMLTR